MLNRILVICTLMACSFVNAHAADREISDKDLTHSTPEALVCIGSWNDCQKNEEESSSKDLLSALDQDDQEDGLLLTRCGHGKCGKCR